MINQQTQTNENRSIDEALLWRSLLYMPANNEKFLAKSQSRGADAIILDLEDSVAPDDKIKAREICKSVIPELVDGPSDILVRINAPLRLAVKDIEAVVQNGVKALFIPKVESDGVLTAIDELITSLEREHGMNVGEIKIVPMLETPKALLTAEKIACSVTRNIGLILGGEDFATSAGLYPSAETLSYPKIQMALAAKAAGLIPLGILDTVADFSDADYMYEVAQKSAKFGFEGATCIHPTMIDALNRGFSPTKEEIDEAMLIIEVMEDAWQHNHGAAQIKGKMIDMPVYKRAKAVVQRAELIKEKQNSWSIFLNK